MSLKWSGQDILVDKNSLILSKLGLGEEIKKDENVVVDVDALNIKESLFELTEKDESERRKYSKKDSPVVKMATSFSTEDNSSKIVSIAPSQPKVEVASVKYCIDQSHPVSINSKYILQQVSDLLTLMPHRIQELDYFKKSLCTKASGLVLVDCFWFVHCKYFGNISQTHRSTYRSTSRSYSSQKASRTTTPDPTTPQKMKEEQKHLMKILSIHFAQFLFATARCPRDDDMIFAFYHYAIAKAIILAFQQTFLPNVSLTSLGFSQRVFRTVTYLFTGVHHSSALHHQVITALFNEYLFESDVVDEAELDSPFTIDDLLNIEDENNDVNEDDFHPENSTHQEDQSTLNTTNSDVPSTVQSSSPLKNSSSRSITNNLTTTLPSILTLHHPRNPKTPPPIYPSQLRKESLSTSPSRTSTPHSAKNSRSISAPLFFETLSLETPNNTTLQHSKSGKKPTSPNLHNNNNNNNNNINNNNNSKLNNNSNHNITNNNTNNNSNNLSPDINSVSLSRSPTHSFLHQKPPSSVVKREKEFQTFSLEETENSKPMTVNIEVHDTSNDVVPFVYNEENEANFDVQGAKVQLKNMLEGMMKGDVRIPVFWNEYTLISQQIRTRTIFFDAYQTSPLIEEYFDNSLPILKKMFVKRTVPVETEASGESLKYYVNAEERINAQEVIMDRYRSVQVESEKRRQKTNSKLHKSFQKINKLQDELLVQHYNLHNFVSKLIKMQAEKTLRESHRTKESLSFLTSNNNNNNNNNNTVNNNNNSSLLGGLEAIDL